MGDHHLEQLEGRALGGLDEDPGGHAGDEPAWEAEADTRGVHEALVGQRAHAAHGLDAGSLEGSRCEVGRA